MSFGWTRIDLIERLAAQVEKILKGTPAGSLPIEQPTRLELAVSRTAAKELGLAIPASILARADFLVD